ncbi:MAG: DAK2 domain-containing protein, partial [Nitriliruptorales bacterium]|nr:DAK2 domain-containing protein [Nitriliruptorales bacterium]
MSVGDGPRPLTLDELPSILERIHGTLVAHREEIDALNVFPVPDGDTGTNMAATAAAALEALGDLDDGASSEERASAIGRGALRGAKGNSGVILSQVIRAFVTILSEEGELDAAGLARTFERARELAYEAVADPVEGTILTTITQAAIRARHCAKEERELGPTLDRVLEDVESTTQDTLRMLKANRDAGVVDAGARGFALVVGALHAHATGVPREPPPAVTRKVERPEPVVAAHETGSLEFRFEVQYLLDAPE